MIAAQRRSHVRCERLRHTVHGALLSRCPQHVVTLELDVVGVAHLTVALLMWRTVDCSRSSPLVRHGFVAHLATHFLSRLDHVTDGSFLVLLHEEAEVDVGLLLDDLVPPHKVEVDLICSRDLNIAILCVQLKEAFLCLVQLRGVVPELLHRLRVLVLLRTSETVNTPLHLLCLTSAHNRLVSIPLLGRSGVDRHRAVLL